MKLSKFWRKKFLVENKDHAINRVVDYYKLQASNIETIDGVV